MKKMWMVTVVLIFGFMTGLAEEPVDLQMISRIKHEGFKNSQVMDILSNITDVHGPRLTGSSGYMKSAEWCRDQLADWGLENAEVAPWGVFGYGWEVERYSCEMTAPYYVNIIGHPKAWTPGTDGVVSGTPIHMTFESDLDEFKGKLKDAIVIFGDPRVAEQPFEADANRFSHEDLTELKQAMQGEDPERAARRARWRSLRKKIQEIRKFLVAEGVAAVLESSWIEHGTLRVMSGGSYKTTADPVVPAMVIALEQFNQILRLLEKDVDVQLEINIQARFNKEDSLGYNVIADIPGTDKNLKSGLVMLGAHLDSWHGGTGATDNGSGCSVMMEAVRILKALDVKPRRTIRIALWDGEEQGLLGSKGYTKALFGDGDQKPFTDAHENFSAYFNIDNGTGKIRGIYLQENDAARPVFEALFKPFHDLGASTVTIRNTSSTDHMAFDALGLPGFQFIQDPIAYRARTWHTNMDVLDHAIEADLQQMSVIVAAIVYHVAMRDERIPRKEMNP